MYSVSYHPVREYKSMRNPRNSDCGAVGSPCNQIVLFRFDAGQINQVESIQVSRPSIVSTYVAVVLLNK